MSSSRLNMSPQAGWERERDEMQEEDVSRDTEEQLIKRKEENEKKKKIHSSFVVCPRCILISFFTRCLSLSQPLEFSLLWFRCSLEQLKRSLSGRLALLISIGDVVDEITCTHGRELESKQNLDISALRLGLWMRNMRIAARESGVILYRGEIDDDQGTSGLRCESESKYMRATLNDSLWKCVWPTRLNGSYGASAHWGEESRAHIYRA